MCLEKIRLLKWHIAYGAIVAIVVVATYDFLGKSPETFTAIATIALVAATSYIAYFNMKLWIAQDKPWLHFYAKKDHRIYIKNIGKGTALNVKVLVKNGSKGDQYFNALSSDEEHVISDFPLKDTNGNLLDFEIEKITYENIYGQHIDQKPINPEIVDFYDSDVYEYK